MIGFVLAVLIVGIAGDEFAWFCNHQMPWNVCQEYLPSERMALSDFMKHLRKTSIPRSADLGGRGIVMSGGKGHVLQALANLRVLRWRKSKLPVEFWHAFELDPVHCEALAEFGATCRTLQMPGVYPHWQTVLPAILSSSFSELIWMDTDITPLINPDGLFSRGAYKKYGALFWPDLWGMECKNFGQTAWPNHVAWHLLEVEHNASDYRCAHEHEAGHLVVHKIRHWRALCLANYLSSRHFFTLVLWGYKDVFRLAWLKMNASNLLIPLRPGLAGSFLEDGRFFGVSLIHWWPADDGGVPDPLYLHQKKKPGTYWGDVVTFAEPLGACVTYNLGALDVTASGVHVWDISTHHPLLLDMFSAAEHLWNEQYSSSLSRFEADPRLTRVDRQRLHPEGSRLASTEFTQTVYACKCEYTDNRWLQIAHWMAFAPWEMIPHQILECSLGFNPEDVSEGIPSLEVCAVGHVARALLCSQAHLREGRLRLAAEAAAALKRFLPKIKKCLRFSFWPMVLGELEDFVINTTDLEGDAKLESDVGLHAAFAEQIRFRGSIEVDFDRLSNFPRFVRRCFPMKDPACFGNFPRSSLEPVPASLVGAHIANGNLFGDTCFFCCDPNIPGRQSCFDDEFTEERCCNVTEE
eukprot:TRINITY_DN31719_c0_g1_i1.p1 TRINITY_DN31719_c0_g1~~TRINITY_DN31719_c0_g1_i1.p1  ORF type:complete len:636 (+),score=72.42 TRINITY_DN31719_c0_g1_i1:123-2030(+)